MSWITLKEFDNYVQAEIVKAKLVSEEIPVLMADNNVSYTLGPTYINGYRLQVRREDYVRAKNICNKILGKG